MTSSPDALLSRFMYRSNSGLSKASLHLTSQFRPQLEILQRAVDNEHSVLVSVLALPVYVIMNSICVRDPNLAALLS
jgi:hypothetical protein